MRTVQVNLQDASFDPTTGILRTERDYTVEYVRIPRSARMVVQLFNTQLTMWFQPGIQLHFDQGDYPDLHDQLVTYWERGKTKPPAR